MSGNVCKPLSGAAAAAAYAAELNNPSNSLGNLAKETGMSSKCVQSASTQSSQTMNDTKVIAAGLWGVVAGGTTTTNNYLDNNMQSSGCGAFALTANTLISTTSNMSCNFNSTTSGQTTKATSINSISYTTVAPSIEVVDSINATVASNEKTVAAAVASVVDIQPWQGESDAKFKLRLKAATASVASLEQLAQDYINLNPTQASLINSNLSFTIDGIVNMKSSQTMDSKTSEKIIQNVKDIAGAIAFNKITQSTGTNSISPESKNMIQNKIDISVTNQSSNINHLIVKNKTTCDQSGNISIVIAGAVIDSTQTISLKSQMDLAVKQVVKTAINIGATIGTDIVNKIHTTNSNSQTSKGLGDLIKLANEALEQQVKDADKGFNSFFGGIFSFFSNIFIIVAIIAVAVVMFLPSIIPALTNIFPPPLKYLLISILVYLIVAWFISFPPFSPPDNRIDDRFLQSSSYGMHPAYYMTNPKKPLRSQFQRPYHHEIVLQ